MIVFSKLASYSLFPHLSRLGPAPFLVLLFLLILCGNGNGNVESGPPLQRSIQPSKPQPAETANEKSHEKKPDSESLKPSFIKDKTNSLNQKTQPNGNQNQHWYNYLKEPLYIVSIILTLFFNALLVRYTWGLWTATKKLSEVSQEHSKHMETSIDIAQQTATAAQKSAKTAVKSVITLQDMEQANISTKIVVEEKSTAENGDIMFKAVLYLRNSGRTSATIRKISFNGIEPTNIVPTVNNLSPEHDPLIPFIGKDEEFREDRYIFRINESTWGEFFFH